MSLNHHYQPRLLDTIDTFLKLLNSSLGRDQCNRLIQYGSKIADDALRVSPQTNHPELIKRVQAMGAAVATARKVARFWRPIAGYLVLIRFLVKIASSQQQQSSFISRIRSVSLLELLRVIEQFCLAHYFLFDHLNWAGKIGLFSNEPLSGYCTPATTTTTVTTNHKISLAQYLFNNARTAEYNVKSSKFWLFGVLAGLIANSIELKGNYKRDQDLLKQTMRIASNKPEYFEQEKNKIVTERNALIRKLIVGVCDVGVASSFSGYWKTKEWVVGLCGVIPALFLIYDLWPPAAVAPPPVQTTSTPTITTTTAATTPKK